MPAEHTLPASPQRAGTRLDATVLAAVVAVAAAVVSLVAWTHPAKVDATVHYTQSGQLTYSGTTSPTSEYGRAGLTTGDPVYGDAVSQLKISYTYQLQSAAPAGLHGTDQLVATLGNGQGLTRSLPLQTATHFDGTRVVASGVLDMAKLQTAANSFGQAGSSQETLAISPAIHARGQLGAAPLRVTFNQAVTFSYTPGIGSAIGVLTPEAASQNSTGTASPGAGPATSPGGSSNTSPFTASSQGAVQVPDGQPATLLVGLSVAKLRLAAPLVLFVALAMLGLFGRRLLREVNSNDERVRITTRYGTRLVETAALPGRSALVVDVSTFDGLHQVARRLECPILHQGGAVGDVYAVVDSGTLYRYSIGPTTGPDGQLTALEPFASSEVVHDDHQSIGSGNGSR